MNTESNLDMTRDTTLTESAGHPSPEPGSKRRRAARRRTPIPPRPATNKDRADGTSSFKVPIGDSGEVFESVWYFGA